MCFPLRWAPLLHAGGSGFPLGETSHVTRVALHKHGQILVNTGRVSCANMISDLRGGVHIILQYRTVPTNSPASQDAPRIWYNGPKVPSLRQERLCRRTGESPFRE